jgi:hypothetical protein
MPMRQRDPHGCSTYTKRIEVGAAMMATYSQALLD